MAPGYVPPSDAQAKTPAAASKVTSAQTQPAPKDNRDAGETARCRETVWPDQSAEATASGEQPSRVQPTSEAAAKTLNAPATAATPKVAPKPAARRVSSRRRVRGQRREACEFPRQAVPKPAGRAIEASGNSRPSHEPKPPKPVAKPRKPVANPKAPADPTPTVRAQLWHCATHQNASFLGSLKVKLGIAIVLLVIACVYFLGWGGGKTGKRRPPIRRIRRTAPAPASSWAKAAGWKAGGETRPVFTPGGRSPFIGRRSSCPTTGSSSRAALKPRASGGYSALPIRKITTP